MSLLSYGERWYAVQTRSNFEKAVTSELSAKGFETYCPAFKITHQWADRKKLVEPALFPGYVFARFLDAAPTRLRVLQAHGAVRILGIGEKIEPIPDLEIQSIRQLLKRGNSCFPHPFLPEGSWVRVRRGALKGVEGKLVRIKTRMRLVLSVTLLSTSIATEVEACDVEIVRRIHSA